MALLETASIITLDGTGTEIPTIVLTDPCSFYVLQGSVTTTGNYAIVPTGTPIVGYKVEFYIDGVIDITTNSKTFSIFGKTLTQLQLSSPQKIECRYLGSSWFVHIIPSFGSSAIISQANLGANSVPASAIPNDSITDAKLATMTAASLKYGNASGDPGNLAIGNNQIPIGNGTTITTTTVSSLYGSMISGKYFVIYGDISWTSGEQNKSYYYLPAGNSYSLQQILFRSYSDMSSGGSAELEVFNSGTSIYANTAVFGSAAAAGASNAFTFSPVEPFSAGDTLELLPSKSTPGGKAKFTALFLIV